MKKLFLFLILFSLWIVDARSQSITGDWNGLLKTNSISLRLVFHINKTGDKLSATLDSPDQKMYGLECDTVFFNPPKLRIEMKKLGAFYEGVYLNGSVQFKGTFTQHGMSLPLDLSQKAIAKIKPNRPQTPVSPFPYTIEEVTFKNNEQGNILAGTITTPKNLKKFPIVVMITGSGAQDRDETLFDHKPFWVIADHFARNGIGTLRMDDRGVGESSKGKENPTTADFATDINSAVEFLKAKGYKNIGLAGHSEGAMIAPMVSGRNKNVKFIISLAGPGIRIDSLMLLQLSATLKSMNIDEFSANLNKTVVRKAYGFFQSYKGDSLKRDLQQYLDKEVPLGGEMNKNVSTQLANPWYDYFIKFNPGLYISKLKIPVLVLNGSKDIQVVPEENLAGWKESLTRAENTKYTIKQLSGLNHLFQTANKGTFAEYAELEETISPEVLQIMTDWILKINK